MAARRKNVASSSSATPPTKPSRGPLTSFAGTRRVPPPVNDPIRSYAPKSPERAEIKSMLKKMAGERIDIPLFIGGQEVHTGDTAPSVMPHDHKHVLGDYHRATGKHVSQAIAAAAAARADWGSWAWEDRAAVFLRAAELLATTWRQTLNAATMLGQSKTIFQAEIDAACELVDFWRFNPAYAQELYAEQPLSTSAMWNQLDYRPLEGFVYAVTPFNFTSIGGNLPTAPALMGNTVIWKPASSAMFSAYYIMKLLEAAGLPPGVINMVAGDASTISDVALNHRDLAGVHFTGSTGVFNSMWKTIGANMDRYATYPRIVGETGGKDFIVAHASADPQALAVAIARGGFEYQGQKCSAASRVYVPKSLWPDVRDRVVAMMDEMKMGDPRDFRNFVGAVIDGRAHEKIGGYVADAKRNAKIIAGGKVDGKKGFFISPTLVEAKQADYRLLCEEIFGPVVTAYAYDDSKWSETLKIVDRTSPYALTGAVFANDRGAVREASQALRNAAGNFYVNDKPTGAVVGQQPFGGARASGTNDKAGSKLNLVRWISARSIKETFSPPLVHHYPFMGDEVIVVSRKQVYELLSMRDCIEVMGRALAALARGESMLPLRTVMKLPSGKDFFAVMPAYVGSPPAMGAKVITVFPGNHGTALDSHQGAVLLLDADKGSIVAVIDAASITAIRTAAVSAVATKYLSRKDAGDLAILGSGVQARSHIEAISLVRPLKRIRVWSRTLDNARKLAQSISATVKVEPMASAEEAVRGASIICTATSSGQAVLNGTWLAPGAHVNAVGASTPQARELDSEAIVRSSLFADRRESVLKEAGDFLIPLSEGKVTPDHIVAEIGEVVAGMHPGRTRDDEITVFKSLGLAVEDVASAHHVYVRAMERSIGTVVDLDGA